MQPIVVWKEIPVTDLQKSTDFYGNVFGWNMQITNMGPNEVATFNALTDADPNSVAAPLSRHASGAIWIYHPHRGSRNCRRRCQAVRRGRRPSDGPRDRYSARAVPICDRSGWQFYRAD